MSASKRSPRYQGKRAYFDFRGAQLTAEVTRSGGVRSQGTPLSLPARAVFPEEVCPVKGPDDPPGAFRAVSRKLPGSRKLGIPQSKLGPPGTTGPVQDAAEEVAAVLPHVLATGESAAGFAAMRRQVISAITGARHDDN